MILKASLDCGKVIALDKLHVREKKQTGVQPMQLERDGFKFIAMTAEEVRCLTIFHTTIT